MGLREKKARKTRERILSEALRLFKRDGYEQTAMEAIAEAAEVSASTLYRYFPSKDLILLDHYMFYFEGLPANFSKFAVDHTVDEALVKAIFAVLKSLDDNPEKVLLVRSIIDESPVPRARLIDLAYIQLEKMSRLLAEKLKLPKDDLRIELTVQMVHAITGVASDRWRADGGSKSAVAYAKQVIKILENGHSVWPVTPTARNERNGQSPTRPDLRP